MNRRVIGLFLVLLLLGGGAGYALADATEPEAARASGPDPVPAVSPAVPTVAAIVTEPDPDDPELAVNLPVESALLQNGKRLPGLRVNLPIGWTESHLAKSNEWNFADPDRSTNTYKLRINLLKGSHLSVSGAKGARIAALRSTLEDGNFQTFDE